MTSGSIIGGGASFSSNGLHLVIAGAAGWDIFNANAGSHVSKLIPQDDILEPASAVAYQPNLDKQQALPRIVAGRAHGAIQRWELYGEQQSAPEHYVDKDVTISTGSDPNRCCAHAGTINDLVFTPDGQWLASAGEDGDVKIWDQARNLKAKFHQPFPVKAVDFSADGKLVAAAFAAVGERGG